MGQGNERRSFQIAEVRLSENDKPPRISGHAAVFNLLSDDLGGFRERIKPGAFTRTIRESDIRALWNHSANFVLGRNTSGTLRLWEDDEGLAFEILPPNTQWARDAMATMRRGDVDQMSFGFEKVRDEWHTADDGLVRTLIEVKLYDVSPVTFPAYPQTSAQVRAKVHRLLKRPSRMKLLRLRLTLAEIEG